MKREPASATTMVRISVDGEGIAVVRVPAAGAAECAAAALRALADCMEALEFPGSGTSPRPISRGGGAGQPALTASSFFPMRGRKVKR